MEKIIKKLKLKSTDIRAGILEMIYHAGSGHIGGSLSCTDILTVLYFNTMNHETDHFILSKGHSIPALYSVLGETGAIDKKQYKTLRKLGGLQGHPDRNTPGIEFNSGSLGQGFSFSIGKALGKLRNKESGIIYTLLGCGECQEGQVWEGAMFAAHHGLRNLVAIIDYNKLQSDNLNNNIMTLEPFADKWKAFGWNVIEVNGHDYNELIKSFFNINSNSKPTVIIAHTIKGKGISFMENNPKWHGSCGLTNDEYNQAINELKEIDNAIIA